MNNQKHGLFSGNMTQGNSSNTNNSIFMNGNKNNQHNYNKIFPGNSSTHYQNSNNFYHQKSSYPIENMNQMNRMNQPTPVNQIFGGAHIDVSISTHQTQTKLSGRSLFSKESNQQTNVGNNIMMIEGSQTQNLGSEKINNSGRDIFTKASTNYSSSLNTVSDINQSNVSKNVFMSVNKVNQNTFNPSNIFGSNNLLFNKPISNQMDINNMNMNQNTMYGNYSMIDDVDISEYECNSFTNDNKEISQNKISSEHNYNIFNPNNQNQFHTGVMSKEQFEDEIRKEYNILKIL